MIRNRHDWQALCRALWVFENPLQFLSCLLRRSAPSHVGLRTPTGRVTLYLRNFESLETVFSVFCREDYRVSSDRPLQFLDVGANIGVSAVYFLTRNSRNTVRCYEPDSENLEFLRDNLAAFGARAPIVERAVSIDAFADVLAEVDRVGWPSVVKLDADGIERQLVGSIDFANYPHVERLFCEATDCGELIRRRHVRSLRNGYVEDLRFVSSAPC